MAAERNEKIEKKFLQVSDRIETRKRAVWNQRYVVSVQRTER